MSTLTLTSRPTIVDRFIPRSLAADVALVAAAVGLISLAAQVVVPMWPVPVTGQTFAVLLSAAALGANRGMIASAVYMVLGLAGAPVFAGASHGVTPSTGYVVGFILASLVVGRLAERQWDRKVVGTFVSFLAGSATIYVFGVAGFIVVTGADLLTSIQVGVVPFLFGDAVKAILAAVMLPAAWLGVRKLWR